MAVDARRKLLVAALLAAGLFGALFYSAAAQGIGTAAGGVLSSGGQASSALTTAPTGPRPSSNGVVPAPGAQRPAAPATQPTGASAGQGSASQSAGTARTNQQSQPVVPPREVARAANETARAAAPVVVENAAPQVPQATSAGNPVPAIPREIVDAAPSVESSVVEVLAGAAEDPATVPDALGSPGVVEAPVPAMSVAEDIIGPVVAPAAPIAATPLEAVDVPPMDAEGLVDQVMAAPDAAGIGAESLVDQVMAAPDAEGMGAEGLVDDLVAETAASAAGFDVHRSVANLVSGLNVATQVGSVPVVQDWPVLLRTGGAPTDSVAAPARLAVTNDTEPSMVGARDSITQAESIEWTPADSISESGLATPAQDRAADVASPASVSLPRATGAGALLVVAERTILLSASDDPGAPAGGTPRPVPVVPSPWSWSHGVLDAFGGLSAGSTLFVLGAALVLTFAVSRNPGFLFSLRSPPSVVHAVPIPPG